MNKIMNKRNILLIMGVLTPSVVFAHGEEILSSLFIVFLLSLILSLILLERISRILTVNNKLTKFFILFITEIILLFLLFVALFYTLGQFLYFYVF